jgi:uncharacterized protein YndB with AHSA1/START domain
MLRSRRLNVPSFLAGKLDRQAIAGGIGLDTRMMENHRRNYHIVFVTPDGKECSFRGTYLEIEPPTRTVATWLFEGWPDAHAVETVELHETDGVTTLTTKMAFRDQAGRAHMSTNDGQEDSFNKLEDYLTSLLAASGAASE